jgi:hypothetical protein
MRSRARTRDAVIKNFPAPPGLPKDKDAYLRFIDEIYQSDPYHSLSIEGYSVTPALLDRVRGGGWDPEHHEDDRKSRDALAARGYWQALCGSAAPHTAQMPGPSPPPPGFCPSRSKVWISGPWANKWRI